ncbi:hypothetical protein FRC07_006208 [Ceratobasidium sp. 392]|nr:hypothetical protein FRC07_006208 [Ceratobasidium sp. 392]
MAVSEAPRLPPAFQLQRPAELPSRPAHPERLAQPTTPEIEIDPWLFNTDGPMPDPPAHSDCPTRQPGNISGFSAEGRALYTHAGNPRHPDMPSPAPMAGSSANPIPNESSVGTPIGSKGKKPADGSMGKGGRKSAAKKGKGAAEKVTEGGPLTVKLPSHATCASKK